MKTASSRFHATSLAAAFTLAGLLSPAGTALADAPPLVVMSPSTTVVGEDPVVPGSGEDVESAGGDSICGPFDPDCSRRLVRILSGLHVAPVQVSGGATFGKSGTQAVLRFDGTLVGLDRPEGDLRALMFDVQYQPERGGLQLRFALADSDVVFFCKDIDDGTVYAPVLGMLQNCRPDAAFGIGGTVAQIQWDTSTARVVARWAEVNAVYNFLRNGNGLDYLKNRLNAYAGVSVDTVWPGSTPGATGGGTTKLRANLGITGMLRSEDNHWEVHGLVGYRPNVTSWNDALIETRAQVLYHLLFDRNLMANVGADAQYNYSTVPSDSMGAFTSDRDRHSAYLGAIFGIVWQ